MEVSIHEVVPVQCGAVVVQRILIAMEKVVNIHGGETVVNGKVDHANQNLSHVKQNNKKDWLHRKRVQDLSPQHARINLVYGLPVLQDGAD